MYCGQKPLFTLPPVKGFLDLLTILFVLVVINSQPINGGDTGHGELNAAKCL